MVEQIRRHVSGLPEPQRGDLTVGVGSPDTAARLRLAIEGDNVPVFDPGGSPASGLPVFRLLRCLFSLHREPTFDAFMAFARTPEVLRRLEAVCSRNNLLEILDDFQAQHIPATFEEARSLAGRDESAAPVAAALAEAAETLRILDAAPLGRSLPALLSRLYQGHLATPDLVAGAEALGTLLDRFARVEPLCANRRSAMLLLETAIESEAIRTDRRPGSTDLLGWLELAWEDAPAMLLVDMNDGLIPDAVTSDPFLPDNARKAMNLRDNRMRLARDAYTLESVLRSRREGNVRLFVPRRNHRGDPLKPSRLLFQCADQDLAQRTLHLLADSPSPFAAPKRSRGWPFRPPLPDELPPVTRVSVTSLRDYLACPFMFYLKNIVRMEPVEPVAELDAMTFGTVAHEALDAFASGEFRDSGDAALIEQLLHGAVNRIFRERHGDRLPLPLLIQRNLLLQRMTYAAGVQAGLRAEGWRIVCGERKFDLALDGLRLSGRVDRIDKHADGRVRVIDYKTAGGGDRPERQHLAKVTARTNVQPWALTGDGKQRWKDLQLPLYRFWCAQEHSSGNVECAYFVLPDAVSRTAVLSWNGLADSVVADAWRCAGEIAARIKAGVFWPPRGNLRRDDPFRRIFFEDIVANLPPDFVKAMERRKV
jgi:ATP-dependent helicase/nuclease subunit B